MDNKLEDLKKLTFAELKEILESVEKAIKAERIYLGEVKDAFIQDEDLWVIHNLQLTKVKDLLNKKNNQPMFNENQLIRVKKGIDDLKIWNRRRNNLIEEIKRREWGSEYFDRGKVHISENNTEVTKEVTELVETKDDPENERFRKMFDELVEHHFKTDILIWQLETSGQDKDDDYIEYCVKRFKRRTITEWMKYYERLDKVDQYSSLKKANLSPELDYKNTMRITNAKFEESTLGQFTLENLELFESKYVNDNYPYAIKTKIKNIREQITNTVKKIIPIKSEIKKIEQRIKDLELKFDTDIDDFPNDLKYSMQSYQEELKAKNETLDKYRYQLWGTFSNEGLIWKHDRLVRQFKKESIGDEELFQELDYKNTDRFIQQLKDKIINTLDESERTVNEEELDDIVLEVLKQNNTDEDDIFDEIIYPEKSEQNLQRTINKVLQDNFAIKESEEGKPKVKEEYEAFNYNYADIINYARKLEINQRKEYLNGVLLKSKEKEFDLETDRLNFERALITEISDLELNIDLTKEFKNGKFKIYNFEEKHIIRYLNNIEEINYKKNYLEYILREIIKVKDNIDIKLIAKETINLRYSEYFEKINRNAIMYEKYGKSISAEPDDYYINSLQDERKKLLTLYESIEDEYKFVNKIDSDKYALIERDKSSEKSKMINTTTMVEESDLNQSKIRQKIKTSNEVIAEEVAKRFDDGIEEFEEIYKIISKESKKIFGEELTAGQIKGRYQRYTVRNEKYKREKYK